MKLNIKSIKEAINNKATKRTKTTSTRSLKAIMESIDFNVYRYRSKTGKTILGKRGGKADQKKLQDCMKINMPDGFSLYAFNINQFLDKANGKYPLVKVGPEGKEQMNNIRVDKKNDFNINVFPKEILSDLGVAGKKELKANKDGYAAFITKGGKIYPLRKTKYENIKIHGSPSKKMIYREKRDGSLENSFIKVLGCYILSTVVDGNGKALINMDIDPKMYNPKKENSDKEGESNSNITPVVANNTLELEEKEIETKENIIKTHYIYDIVANLEDLLEDDEDGDKEEDLTEFLEEVIPLQIETVKGIELQRLEIEGEPLSVTIQLKTEKRGNKKESLRIEKLFRVLKIKDSDSSLYSIPDESYKEIEYEYDDYGIELEEYELKIKAIVNSDDLDAAKEYCNEKNIDFYYDGKKGEMMFVGDSKKDLEKVQSLFENN